MIVLITGGSKCGKSSMAESIMAGHGKGMEKYYIATMEPFGEEAEEAIKRHRKQREGKGFKTIEQYVDLGHVCARLDKAYEKNAVILECICNLCANEMFSPSIDIPFDKRNAAGKIIADVRALAACCSLLIIVTNQVGEDGVQYSFETMEYIKNMGIINQGLAGLADTVIEAVYGRPFFIKGECDI